MSEAKRSNFVSILLVVALAGGAWFFFQRYEIDGLDGIAVRPKGTGDPAGGGSDDLRSYLAGRHVKSPFEGVPPLPGTRDHQLTEVSGPGAESWFTGAEANATASASAVGFRSRDSGSEAAAGAVGKRPEPEKIRIAAWSLAGFGRDKAGKPHVMDIVARVVRSFDLIALQDLMPIERDLLPEMVEHINRTGRRYDFLLAPPASSRVSGEPHSRMAFLFDTDRVVTDRTQFYTVADPDSVYTHDPIVGWFQVVGPPPSRAWTFSLVNIHVDLANARSEVALLPQVLAAVRDDGRQEDDVLLAGLFQADDAYLLPTIGASTISAVVRATPTDIFSRHQTSNIILPVDATTEFLGGGGVVDFLRVYNLSSAQAEEVTPYLPVYGEFAAREGA